MHRQDSCDLPRVTVLDHAEGCTVRLVDEKKPYEAEGIPVPMYDYQMYLVPTEWHEGLQEEVEADFDAWVERGKDAEARQAAEQDQQYAMQQALQSASAIIFVQQAQSETLDDVTISEHAALFVQWNENWRGKRGDIVRDDGKLFRSLHDVTNKGQNTKPSETPSMWKQIGDPGDEWPQWSQPYGAGDDLYMTGDKVTYEDKHWVSDIDNNVWVPGVHGWTEVTG